MKQKIIIKRNNGKFTVKGNGDGYLWELASGAVKRGEVEPTFGMKLRRFFRRLRSELRFRADITVSQVVGSELAAEVPYIGLEEYAGD